MLIKSITFPTYLEECSDIETSNIDVFVESEDGYIYTVIVGTAENIIFLMTKNKTNYFEPGCLFIIVKKLTENIIREAIEAYASKSDGYWLKLHHFAQKIDPGVFNKLQTEHMKYLKELDELDKLDNS